MDAAKGPAALLRKAGAGEYVLSFKALYFAKAPVIWVASLGHDSEGKEIALGVDVAKSSAAIGRSQQGQWVPQTPLTINPADWELIQQNDWNSYRIVRKASQVSLYVGTTRLATANIPASADKEAGFGLHPLSGQWDVDDVLVEKLPEPVARVAFVDSDSVYLQSEAKAMEWSEREFSRQHQGLVKLLGQTPVTNKNHYLRWEGDCEFFDWCARHGIQLDQSKGASKTGEGGFNFGTSRPYFPVTFEGRMIDVLELPTPLQDLNVFAPQEVVDPLLAMVRRTHGVLHLLFHPAHAQREGVMAALLMAVQKARAMGMEWRTARRINA
jgi:hypothetical protein